MISKYKISAIYRLKSQNFSIRGTAKELGISRKTVRKYLQNKKPPKIIRNRTSKLDPFKDSINQFLEKKPLTTAINIFKDIKYSGFCGSYSLITRYLRKKRGKFIKSDCNNISLNELSILKAKTELLNCMIKGMPYVEAFSQFFEKDINENDLILSQEERLFVIYNGKNGNTRVWRIGVVAELANIGLGKRKISKLLNISRNTVKKYIKKFDEVGLNEAVKIKKKKSKNTDLKTKRILEILHQKPNLFRINRSNWNRESIANVYEKQYGERIGISTVGRLINNAGYKMKKAKQVLTSPDPDYQEKVELLLKTIQSLNYSEMLFFIDELGPLRVKKYGGRCYIKKEDVFRVPKVQIPKGSITLSAALSATTNQIAWNYGKSKDTSAMIDLIEILYNQYYDKSKIFITWDAASWHRSNELHDWLDKFNTVARHIGEGPVIEFVPLPTSSQFLNVIESIFSGMKRAVIHHSDYPSQEKMKLAISIHFKERNEYFRKNPKRAGKKIWDVDFFKDYNNIKSGNYREW